jgi:hypothetical protein
MSHLGEVMMSNMSIGGVVKKPVEAEPKDAINSLGLSTHVSPGALFEDFNLFMVVLHECDGDDPEALEVDGDPIVLDESVGVEIAEIECHADANRRCDSTDHAFDSLFSGFEDAGEGPVVGAIGEADHGVEGVPAAKLVIRDCLHKN